ncbi:undecaprenyl-diphosphatase [Chengkuizengella sediminis]|uniref:undecaprenyl-diphosphatase n=1 Tax=Chengkuizengella sediminis TaxID=1885917 RepID=UPI00138969AB|nr:undecaprenyl-diphosphatase [Chengkuizengella sediminis]NDI35217.1 undecaprenyl-diphosphatase [Chengkuizengella sediminis]
MDNKISRNIKTGCYSLTDVLMILISNKVRYVFIFLLGFMWFRNNSDKKMVKNAVKSLTVALLINSLIKLFYYKPRPFMKRRVRILIPSKMDSSFPSKHTLLVFAISTTVILCKRLLGLIMLGLSVLTGISRIWVGHHYPSDIIGSAIIGSLIGIVIEKMSRFFNFFYR